MIGGFFCEICGWDIDEIGSDNVSPVSGFPLCENCREELIIDGEYDKWIDEQMEKLEEWY